jgi:hypothetical protein
LTKKSIKTISCNVKLFNNPTRYTLSPGKRHSHLTTVVLEKIYLFGGYNGTYLNDLWQYDTYNQVWRELEVNSLPPPPLKNSSLVHIGSGNVYLIGGMLDLSPTKEIYKYNTSDNEWYQVTRKLINFESPVKTNEFKKYIHSHKIVHCLDSSIFLFGGISGQSINKENFILHDAIDSGSKDDLFSYLNEKKKKGNFTDVMIRTTKEDSFSYIEAHKCVLSARCDYLKQFLSKELEIMEFSENRKFEVCKIDLSEESLTAYIGLFIFFNL